MTTSTEPPTEPEALRAAPLPALLVELQQLHDDLTAAGTTCSLTTRPIDTLLIGTAGGGIITIGLTVDRTSWWANSSTATRIHDLEGADLTTAVHAEIARHAHLAERNEFAA